MLNSRDWKAVFEVYAREPTLALALAYQLIALKQSVERGPKGIPDAITGLNQALEHLYCHTDFHKMARRLYYRTIESTITVKQEDLTIALKNSLRQSNRKPVVTPPNTTKHNSQIPPLNTSSKSRRLHPKKGAASQ
jgi:hypothetical protein